jgi:cytochrome c-type biogenesis protein CcmH
MALGRSKEQILSYFANKYGEKILSSPTTTGFNLTAWVTPFVALFLGTVFVTMTLLSWRRRRLRAPAPPAPLAPVGEGGTSAYEEILNRELERFEP